MAPMRPNPAATGQLIKLLRDREGLTQVDLCFGAGVGRTTLQAIEAGDRNATTQTLKRIASELNVAYHILRYPSARLVDLAWEIETLDEAKEIELFRRLGLTNDDGGDSAATEASRDPNGDEITR